MTPEAQAMRAQYQREWRKRNKERVKQYEAAKWERMAARARAEKELNDG